MGSHTKEAVNFFLVLTLIDGIKEALYKCLLNNYIKKLKNTQEGHYKIKV